MRYSVRTKILAIYPSLNARRFLVRTKVPGNSYQFECDVFVGQDQNSWRYFLVRMRCVFRPEPKFLANVQFECEALCCQNRKSWMCFPVKMRGVFRPGPKFLSALSSLRARRFSVRTEIPGEIFQCEYEAFFGQTRNSWR